MGTFIDKQTNMESDNKWNKLSMEQAQILSLLAKYDNKDSISKKRPSPSTENGPSDDGKIKYQPRPWRTKAPKDGEPFEKITKGGHTFKWDPVGNNGTGFWEFVKSGDNTSGVSLSVGTTPKPKGNILPNVSPQKKTKKTVSFDENTKDATNVSVNKSRLLANLTHLDDSQQSFIAQFVPKE